MQPNTLNSAAGGADARPLPFAPFPPALQQPSRLTLSQPSAGGVAVTLRKAVRAATVPGLLQCVFRCWTLDGDSDLEAA
jgi:hypothetical protein